MSRPVGPCRREPHGAGRLSCRAAIAAASCAILLVAGMAPSAFSQADRKQTRPAKTRVAVPIEKLQVDDGDTVNIRWSEGDTETIRILGIDTPETSHPQHNIPFDQPFGREARGFCQGAFAAAQKIELLRADTTDPYGRTLGYLFINGLNYSVLVIKACLGAESVSHFGDNGFPEEAAAVAAAAKAVGPLPFENPWDYRKRMREYSEASKRAE